MPADSTRTKRLAAALKENLKRRKSKARAETASSVTPAAKALGTAPQAGLEGAPQPGPKTAPKRR